MDYTVLRGLFRNINKYFMVPAFRAGLGPVMGNPLTGYIMVMRTVGRKTGKVRYAPMNYGIIDGDVYCMAGFGPGTHWYRNLKADPNVELIMPSGTIRGRAEEITDPVEFRRIIRKILLNAGWAGFLLGTNPHTISEEELYEKTKNHFIIRIRPTGLASGPSDPGGWLWILVIGGSLLWLLRRGRKRGLTV